MVAAAVSNVCLLNLDRTDACLDGPLSHLDASGNLTIGIDFGSFPPRILLGENVAEAVKILECRGSS